MKNTIILTEAQLKKVINTITEENFRNIKFLPPSGERLSSREQDLLKNGNETYGTRKPYDLYKQLIKDRDISASSNPTVALKISEIIGILEYYWRFNEKPDVYPSKRKERRLNMPNDEPKKPEEPIKPKFSDRFKFNKGDITKFRDE